MPHHVGTHSHNVTIYILLKKWMCPGLNLRLSTKGKPVFPFLFICHRVII